MYIHLLYSNTAATTLAAIERNEYLWPMDFDRFRLFLTHLFLLYHDSMWSAIAPRNHSVNIRPGDHDRDASIEPQQLRESLDIPVLQSESIQYAQEDLLPSVYAASRCA